MASSNQYSRGLKFILASLVLLFFLAITVESRAVGFTSALLPEYTGNKVSSKNRRLVGSAIGYVSLRGKNAFGLSVLAVANVDPKKISRVSVFVTENKKKIIANLKLSGGLYVYDNRINYTTGILVHEHKASVGVWLKNGKNKEFLAIAGELSNNRTTFIAYLQANQLVTSPSGTAKNDAFGIVHAYTVDASTYFIQGALNHDLDERVTEIALHGPATSGQDTSAWTATWTFSNIDQGAKIFRQQVNSTVFFWMSNHLTYLIIKTSKNPSGALRGQLISTTNPRARLPSFPNGASSIFDGIDVTFLPDGSTIIGNLTLALLSGGHSQSNNTIGELDERVAYFVPNNASTFNNNFRFPLPVVRNNRWNLRGASIVMTAGAEVVDSNLWSVAVFNLASGAAEDPFTFTGQGNRTFTTVTADIDPELFPKLLGPGGLFVQVRGAAVQNPLYVDRFYSIYYIASAYANNVIKDIFFKGSDAQNTRR
jgi:hypothetical protein